ncbi:MAG: hypothetical protein Q8L66_04380 [Caulobacter sp.]|nr:hypothetical protein [Caulobacter sp.]
MRLLSIEASTLLAFGLLLAVAVIGALVRGGPVERRGAALFSAAWVTSLGAQALSGSPSPGLWLPIIDATVLAGLANLAWRSPRPWPVYACGFQLLALAGDIAKWVEADLDVRLHLTLLAVMAFGAVAALAIGAWFPPKTARE